MSIKLSNDHALTWIDVYNLLDALHKQFEEIIEHSDTFATTPFTSWPLIIYGLPRGGQLVANLLDFAYSGQYMVLENAYDAMQISHYFGQNMLIVDDIADTGRAARPFLQSGCIMAVLLRRASCIVDINFVGAEIKHEDYVVFPWEKSPSTDFQEWKKRKGFEWLEQKLDSPRKEDKDEVGNESRKKVE